MPGRVFLTTPLAEVAEARALPIPDDAGDPPRHNIAPGQEVWAITAEGLSRMRWGLIPVGRVNARGRPVMETIVNARSETVFDKSAFDGVGRAVLPVNGWYEWTGETRRKTAWRIAPKDGRLLWFAAITDIWHGPGGIAVPQIATVTCPPNDDLALIHHRMAVILRGDDVPLWLSGSAEDVTPLMVPWPNGTLCIEEAAGVDWNGP